VARSSQKGALGGADHRSDDVRRQAIREILTAGGAARAPVASQAELRRRLVARGIRASQATLSRDLALLGVRRAAGARGPRYLMEGDGGPLPLDPLRGLVDAVESNGALVVVRTKASTAMAVARALDEAGLAEVMGTIAGDDTVFVAPRRPRDGDAVARKLRAVLGLG
jgi:transcriptional regulator of arginine metabolism